MNPGGPPGAGRKTRYRGPEAGSRLTVVMVKADDFRIEALPRTGITLVEGNADQLQENWRFQKVSYYPFSLR